MLPRLAVALACCAVSHLVLASAQPTPLEVDVGAWSRAARRHSPGGLVVAVIGLTFLPLRDYVFSKRDLSAFSAVVDLGYFAVFGLAWVAAGILAFALSFTVRGDLSD